jgi:hypothetical protein
MMGRLNHDQQQLFIHFVSMKQFRMITRFVNSCGSRFIVGSFRAGAVLSQDGAALD